MKANKGVKRPRILYILNQKSGADNDSDIENTIRTLSAENRKEHEILKLTGDNNKIRIEEKIREFKPQIVAAAGGDGTVNLVASVISGMSLKLGIIPLGSANGLAFDLGIPEKAEDALELIMKGDAKPMDVVQINEDHISLHLSDVGINARIVKEFEKEGTRGFIGYAKHFFREFFKPQRSFKCSIQIDDKLFTHRAYMAIIANASRYRTGANMNPGGSPDDGKFEIVIMKPYSRWVWRSLLGAFTGTLDKKPNIETYECSSAVIKINPGQEFQVDGESLGKTNEIKATIKKHALNVIMPE